MTEDTKAIVASNLTAALAVLVASGKKENESKTQINKWYAELCAPSQKPELMFPELSE